MKPWWFGVLSVLLFSVLLWVFDIAPRINSLRQAEVSNSQLKSTQLELQKNNRSTETAQKEQALWLAKNDKQSKRLRRSQHFGNNQIMLSRIFSQSKVQVISMKVGHTKSILSWKLRSLTVVAEGSLSSVMALLTQFSQLPFIVVLSEVTLEKATSGVKAVMQLWVVYLHEG